MEKRYLIPKKTIIKRIISFFKRILNREEKNTKNNQLSDFEPQKPIKQEEFCYVYKEAKFKKDIDPKNCKNDILNKYKKLKNVEITTENLEEVDLVMIDKLLCSQVDIILNNS